jgi:hypothetical protein
VTEHSISGADAQRRSVLKGGALLALLYTVEGVPALLSPRAAHAKAVPLQVLSNSERDTLEAIGEVLVPGARAAGLAEYVDHQLAVPYGECLLAARILDVPAPVATFYRTVFSSIDAASQRAYGGGFSSLKPADQIALVKTISTKNPDGWQAAPAPLVFYLLRSDAIDVYYGTPEGYERLGVPYMPHLLPKHAWRT